MLLTTTYMMLEAQVLTFIGMKFHLLDQVEYAKLRYLRNKLIPENKVTQFVVLSRFWLAPPTFEERRHHARPRRCPQPLFLAIP